MRSFKTDNNEVFGGITTVVPSRLPSDLYQSSPTSSSSLSPSTSSPNNAKRKLFLEKLSTQTPISTLTQEIKNKFIDHIKESDTLNSITAPISDVHSSEKSALTAAAATITTPITTMNKNKKYLSNKDQKNLTTSSSSSILLDSVCNGSLSSEWIDQTSSSPSNPSENSVEGSYTADRSLTKQNMFSTRNHLKNLNSNPNSNNNMEEKDDGNDSEQELPSLTWLTRLAVTMFTNPPILDNDTDDNFNGNDGLANNSIAGNGTGAINNSNNGNNKSSLNQNSTNSSTQQRKEDTLTDRYNKFMEQVKVSQDKYYKEEEYYLNNDVDKPIFNYATIIAMAMLENGRMTLQEICTWIEQKFKYYRGKKKWNNSIRHNLSLQYCFRKINRDKFEKGKGGYWELGMDISKGERKRIRNKKSQVANNNTTIKNNNRNCNTSRNGSLSSSSSSSSSPLIPEKRRKIIHQNNKNDGSILSTTSTSSIITTAAIAAGLEHQNYNDHELSSSSSVNSLEKIIFDVLENSDDITSSYHHHHHQQQQQHDYSQQHQLIDDGTNELDVDHETIITSAVTNFLNHHHITDDNGDYCLIDNNLDVLEQTLQHINEQNNNNGCNNCNTMDSNDIVAASFNTNHCNNCINGGNHNYIINTDGTIIASDRAENYVTIDTRSLQNQQQQEQHEHQHQHHHHHSNIENSTGSTIDITNSIVQISTNDGCFGHIVEITSNGDNYLNMNDLNDVDVGVMSSTNSTTIATTSTQQTQTSATTTTTTTTDMFDEELGAVGTMVDPTTMEAQTHHIYSSQQNETEVPESCEDIVASVLNNYPCNGPSVVVEPIPSYNNNNDNTTANVTNCNMNSNTSTIMNSNPSIISDNSIIINNNNSKSNIYRKNLSTLIKATKHNTDLTTITTEATTSTKTIAEISKSTLIPSIIAAETIVTTTPITETTENTVVVTDDKAAREAAIAAAIISSTNFHDEIDEEFNFFKYTDDVDRHNDDVDLFPFDSIASHEF